MYKTRPQLLESATSITHSSVSFDIEVNFCSRHESHAADVRAHGKGEERCQRDEHSGQKTVLNVQEDYGQKCDHPNRGIDSRQAPELPKLFHLEQHPLQRDYYDTG